MSDSVAPEAVAAAGVSGASRQGFGGVLATMPEYENAQAVTARNGGRIVPARTPEQARALSLRRWRAASSAVRTGVADASEQVADIDKRSSLAMLRHIAANHAANAADPSATASATSFGLLLRHGWPEPERAAPGGMPSSALDADLRELLAAWRAAKADNPELAERAQAAARGDDEGGDG